MKVLISLLTILALLVATPFAASSAVPDIPVVHGEHSQMSNGCDGEMLCEQDIHQCCVMFAVAPQAFALPALASISIGSALATQQPQRWQEQHFRPPR